MSVHEKVLSRRALGRRLLAGGALAALGEFLPLVPLACEPRGAEQDSPLPSQPPEYVLPVVIDMSGSYAEQMRTDSGKAYRFLMRVVDAFFRGRMGSEDRIVITQISAVDRALLWDGSPRTLRQQFPGPEKFRDFLLAHSDPNGSRVHDSISDALGYLMDMPGVAQKQTKSAVIVLSDMEENFPEPEKSTARLTQALAAYGRVGGVVGFYWVDQTLVPVWRKRMQEAGLRSWVVESEIVADPALPSFD